VTRHRDQYIADIREALAQVWNRFEIRREFRIRKVAGVDAIARNRFELRFVAPPDSYITAAARKLQRQRRAPGPGADDRYRL